jgi:hypothetical protein
MPSWGRVRLFRYEVHCWRDGTIPDLPFAVDSPRRVSNDEGRARRVLDLVTSFPTATWGRDEQAAEEMWNSNSLTARLAALTQRTRPRRTRSPAPDRWTSTGVVRWTNRRRKSRGRGTNPLEPMPVRSAPQQSPAGAAIAMLSIRVFRQMAATVLDEQAVRGGERYREPT